ncbi:MAG: RNA polymerase sigma factor SigW, partial [Planctomycetota bacterium]
MAGDTQLVREFQSGDRDAFAKLVERYQNYVCSL